jgi:hypothetical protein
MFNVMTVQKDHHQHQCIVENGIGAQTILVQCLRSCSILPSSFREINLRKFLAVVCLSGGILSC